MNVITRIEELIERRVGLVVVLEAQWQIAKLEYASVSQDWIRTSDEADTSLQQQSNN